VPLKGGLDQPYQKLVGGKGVGETEIVSFVPLKGGLDQPYQKLVGGKGVGETEIVSERSGKSIIVGLGYGTFCELTKEMLIPEGYTEDEINRRLEALSGKFAPLESRELALSDADVTNLDELSKDLKSVLYADGPQSLLHEFPDFTSEKYDGLLSIEVGAVRIFFAGLSLGAPTASAEPGRESSQEVNLLTRLLTTQLMRAFLVCHGFPDPVAKFIGNCVSELLFGPSSEDQRFKEKWLSLAEMLLRGMF
jgi:hypothetical protein